MADDGVLRGNSPLTLEITLAAKDDGTEMTIVHKKVSAGLDGLLLGAFESLLSKDMIFKPCQANRG